MNDSDMNKEVETPTTPPTETPPVQSGVDDLLFKEFKFQGVPDSVRSKFGCNGNYEQNHFKPVTSWSKTWNVSSRDEMIDAVNQIKEGERILIANGTSIGTIDLKSAGGIKSKKKYIMGSSGCNGNGDNTLTGFTRFIIDGDNWVIMNLKIAESESNTMLAGVSGAGNIFYNNYLSKTGGVRMIPKGEFRSTATIGNKFINNFMQGRGPDGVANPAIVFFHPYNGKGPATYDTAIIGNDIVGFADRTFGAKAITDVSWGLNHPAGGIIKPDPVFIELAHNHFQKCNNEVFTSKTSKHWIHDNLFENLATAGDPGHMSFRAGGDKLFTRNIMVTPGPNSVIINGELNRGFYNVLISPHSNGWKTTWTSSEDAPSVPGGKFRGRETVKNADWQWNFFMGTKERPSQQWMTLAMAPGREPELPPNNNTVKNNIYCSKSPESLSWWLNAYDGHEAIGKVFEETWVKTNPDAIREGNHFGTKGSSDICSLPSQLNMPSEIKTTKFWLDNKDVITTRPSWIDNLEGSIIKLK